MDEIMTGVVFGMLLIQVMSMYDNSKRLDHLEKVIALQMKSSELLSLSIQAQLDDQKAFRVKSTAERTKQYKDLAAEIAEKFQEDTEAGERDYQDIMKHMDARSADRITRTEVQEWRDEIAQLFPWLPQIPRINAPHRHPPLLPNDP
jgi:hypothetical protein